MKFLSIMLVICLYWSNTKAQGVNYQSLAGKWEYDSPKKKNKVLYDFALDKNFTSTTEHKEKELVVKGTYQIDKINEIDRLKLSTLSAETQSKTIINNYFVKFLNIDTLKVQMVTDKQENWRPENRRNTMIFTRKKEKPKEIK
ncbi:hypothetical protein EZ428_22890 [Pedobacter frigiditerrae]|uniref:Lipocalin-like domain-containing protein n=1 Tax=Pedobacter frigiditerrae TaxID=2530452 RepID=A0A4R0MKA9_9SPHI|nr:hypothetical protein [Pedobacter frigiditerrae]TCC87048.1 hypothetical protein EZ428_22890 [Pedobacter frigiditerrae]